MPETPHLRSRAAPGRISTRPRAAWAFRAALCAGLRAPASVPAYETPTEGPLKQVFIMEAPGRDAEPFNAVRSAFLPVLRNRMIEELGLSICRSIVAAHQGRLWAESGSPPGGAAVPAVPGATFHLELPAEEES